MLHAIDKMNRKYTKDMIKANWKRIPSGYLRLTGEVIMKIEKQWLHGGYRYDTLHGAIWNAERPYR